MRILIINHFPLVGSGSGVYVSDIAKNLHKKGHQACIIMPENTMNFAKIEGIKIHPVYFKREENIEGQVDFNFPCMDPHPRSSFLFNDMTELQVEQYVKAFRKAIEEEIETFKPDVIHVQHIWILAGILKNYDVPYVITSHGAEFITYNRTDMFDKFGNDAISGCKRVISISKENEDEIIAKFPDAKEKMIFARNGYNTEEFFIKNVDKKSILDKVGIKKEYDKIVLFVGRVSKMKGLDILINAAKRYEKDNIATLIIGDGEYRKNIEKMAKEFRLKNIYFAGNVKHSELSDFYNMADVLVLPSRKEALPLVAIESLACGTPAIVTDKTGMEDIITEDVGLTFEMDNDEMLAEKINEVLNKEVNFNPEHLSEYVKKGYSQENLMNILLKLYEEVKK